MSDPPLSDLINTTEAARLAGVHPDTIRVYGREGRVEMHRLHKRLLLFSRVSVEALAAELAADQEVSK